MSMAASAVAANPASDPDACSKGLTAGSLASSSRATRASRGRTAGMWSVPRLLPVTGSTLMGWANWSATDQRGTVESRRRREITDRRAHELGASRKTASAMRAAASDSIGSEGSIAVNDHAGSRAPQVVISAPVPPAPATRIVRCFPRRARRIACKLLVRGKRHSPPSRYDFASHTPQPDRGRILPLCSRH